MAIDRFVGDYAFLSNFYVVPRWRTAQLWAYCPIDGGGYRIPTVEHGYQAAKASKVEEFHEVIEAKTAADAKRLGQRVKIANLELWNAKLKDTVMLRLVSMKFNPRSHPILAQLLVDTGDEELMEGNTWGDTYWGVCDGRGQNRLGKILMQVRKEIR